jgi:hypothetical protein
MWIGLFICGILSLLNGLTDIPDEEEDELEKRIAEDVVILRKDLKKRGYSQ